MNVSRLRAYPDHIIKSQMTIVMAPGYKLPIKSHTSMPPSPPGVEFIMFLMGGPTGGGWALDTDGLMWAMETFHRDQGETQWDWTHPYTKETFSVMEG